jgi:hypothetical protein
VTSTTWCHIRSHSFEARRPTPGQGRLSTPKKSKPPPKKSFNITGSTWRWSKPRSWERRSDRRTIKFAETGQQSVSNAY